MTLPLADVRVIALEQYGAGPWGTLQLADLGAEVIKIEDPASRGDVGRYVPPFQEGESSLFFETFNRNKKSVSLDLRHPDARAVFEDLVRVADVVYSNLRGDQPAKLRLTYDDLKHLNPRVVCCSLSGFGMTGPRASEGGYDYMMQGRAGWMSLTGDPDAPPTKSGLSLVDLSGGYVSTIAVLAGLWRARRDGVGCDADVSLFETALHQLMYQGTWAATGRYVPRRMAAERIGSSTSRLRSRAAKSVKRSSASRSGRPSTSHRRSQNFGLAQATVIQPSAVWKAWNGTIDGCAESAIRRGT
jgi:crotonobetainyl-CoA:carnitine CoA-transferase CaiB-like acyl-CoA transferase